MVTPRIHERIFQLSNNMAATTRESPSSRYPSEKSVKEALDMLKPPGILSKAYNQFQLKRYQVSPFFVFYKSTSESINLAVFGSVPPSINVNSFE